MNLKFEEFVWFFATSFYSVTEIPPFFVIPQLLVGNVVLKLIGNHKLNLPLNSLLVAYTIITPHI